MRSDDGGAGSPQVGGVVQTVQESLYRHRSSRSSARFGQSTRPLDNRSDASYVNVTNPQWSVMASLQDIARQTGLSVMTVSRALRKDASASPATRQRVQDCAKRLGYRPHLSARSLRTGHSQTFCVICRDTSERNFVRIAGFSGTAAAAGYATSVIFIPRGLPDSAAVVLALDNVLRQGVSGVSILPDNLPCDALVRVFVSSGLSAVAVDPALSKDDLPPRRVPARPRAASLCDAVWIDRQWGVQAAVRRLIEQGCRRIVYVGLSQLNSRGRCNGYLRGIKGSGIQPQTVITRRHGFEDGRSAADRLLLLNPRPDAVLCYDDLLALGVIHRFSERGLQVPEEIAVVGFDDLPAAAYAFPELTTVALPNWEAGEAAARILLRRAAGDPTLPGGLSMTLRTRLVVRRSTLQKNNKRGE
jgi:LacI family transcriptional regulator